MTVYGIDRLKYLCYKSLYFVTKQYHAYGPLIAMHLDQKIGRTFFSGWTELLINVLVSLPIYSSPRFKSLAKKSLFTLILHVD